MRFVSTCSALFRVRPLVLKSNKTGPPSFRIEGFYCLHSHSIINRSAFALKLNNTFCIHFADTVIFFPSEVVA